MISLEKILYKSIPGFEDFCEYVVKDGPNSDLWEIEIET